MLTHLGSKASNLFSTGLLDPTLLFLNFQLVKFLKNKKINKQTKLIHYCLASEPRIRYHWG